MTRLLSLAEFLFGAETRHRVFDPLVADAHSEINRSRMPALARLRWQIAMLTALVACTPRAFMMPPALLMDLLVRAGGCGGFVLGIQQIFIWRGWPGTPVTSLTSLTFAIVPAIWRLRVSSLPLHQKRFIAVAITVCCAAVMALAPGVSLPMRAAMAAMPLFPAFVGWRFGDAQYWKDTVYPHSFLFQGVKLGSVFQVAAWLPLLASGHSIVDTYWPGKTALGYLLGVVVIISILKSRHVQDQESV